MDVTLDGIRDVRLYQGRRGYRFSLDSVLLYSFVRARKLSRIADLGAGSGVVGILLARKFLEAGVTLIELQESLFSLAQRNIALNGLQDRVTALRCDIREMPDDLSGFDLVVSNPPFRKPLSGLLSEGRERAVARHELELTLPALVGAASRMLRHGGRFCMIYHPERLAELAVELRAGGLEPKRMRFVHGRRDSEARMVLVESARGGRAGLKVEGPLVVYLDKGGYSSEVREMVGADIPR